MPQKRVSETSSREPILLLLTVQAVAKLRRQVKRTKEVLSANTFAPISVEELQEGHDFRSRIDRCATAASRARYAHVAVFSPHLYVVDSDSGAQV